MVVVAGGTGAIGRAVVEAFTASGHTVLVPTHHLPATIAAAEAVCGPVDCLINAAGDSAEGSREIGVLLEMLLPGMRRRRGGTIIHIDATGETRQAAETCVRVISLALRPGRQEFIAPAELAEIALYCYRLPQRICVRDLVLTPTGV